MRCCCRSIYARAMPCKAKAAHTRQQAGRQRISKASLPARARCAVSKTGLACPYRACTHACGGLDMVPPRAQAASSVVPASRPRDQKLGTSMHACWTSRACRGSLACVHGGTRVVVVPSRAPTRGCLKKQAAVQAQMGGSLGIYQKRTYELVAGIYVLAAANALCRRICIMPSTGGPPSHSTSRCTLGYNQVGMKVCTTHT